MTIRQRQHLLAYLGYYTGSVDGLWGPKSRDAATRFQREYGGLTPDGTVDGDTEAALRQAVAEGMPEREADSFWEEIHYFSREEFRCKCGGRFCSGYPAEMKQAVVLVADRARAHFGAPAHVVSGLRCRQHNANSGGVENSQHMSGEAVDLRIDGVSADTLLAFVRFQPEVRYAYKINSTNVHFDIPREAG
ncbi:MAG: peptidoglycan-binding protein [Oscillospiraceae bacterium]|nr:peptidoglycan-binding protein [Oscillospiraceae bacterium]